MVEQISKRLGSEYIMFGTSMVYFFAQALTASLVQILGWVMREKTRYSSIAAIVLSMGFIMLAFLSSLVADWKSHTPFIAVVSEKFGEG
jgi:uncharacterized membrane protein